MNRKKHRWPKLFGLIYGIVLVCFTTYVLLDTFVIPRGEVVVSSTSDASGDSVYVTGSDTITGSDSDASESSNPSGDEAKNSSDTDGSTGAETADNSGTDGSTGAGTKDSESTDGSTEDSSDESGAASTDPVVTDTSYDDGNISITIRTERIHDTTVYIADVQLSDISYLKTAFAQNTYGRNIKETTSGQAADHNAILAINGDYYGFRDYGYVLRNGTLYRDTGGNGEDLVIDADGTMRIIEEDEVSAEELENEGALQVLSFGPALVNDGEIVVGENEEVDQSMTSNPRTAIGMISPLHYIIVVSDGRTDESAGLTLYELAEVFEENGASVAYNLDGGGSSTLYFNGEVINNPAGGMRSSGERKVSDILYFGYE